MIGSDFVDYEIKHLRHCSECNVWMPKGTIALASIKDGKVRKVVCGEECRLAFDDRFWRSVAAKNKKRRGAA